MTRIQKAIAVAAAVGGLAWASFASAQVPFPQNWANAPTGKYRQDVYPYPGQCYSGSPIAGLPQCTTTNAPSFACEPAGSGFPNQTNGTLVQNGVITGTPLIKCGQVFGPTLVNPILPETQKKFALDLLNPPDYNPDKATYPGADYYEIGLHEAWGFQAIATAGTLTGLPLFPDPTQANLRIIALPNGTAVAAGAPVPNGQQWTGLVCPGPTNCTCPNDAAWCTPGATIPPGTPLYTPIWGVGQKNMGGGPVTSLLATLGIFNRAPGGGAPVNSPNDYIATWPSISIRAQTGRPVVVKWINEFPNNHVFCPHPEAADWGCAIDRTFMGVKATVDPATVQGTGAPTVPFDQVNQFGGAQQPDNSWVTHLHGGEIPPQTDGFAEKWYGNFTTGAKYAPSPWLINPTFEMPFGTINPIYRPGGTPGNKWQYQGFSSWAHDTYTYPVVNDEATIWFHTHTLGKTHHDVIAGPAGFFPVKDPTKHKKVTTGVCSGPSNTDCEYTWIDPITEPRDATTGFPLYDLFLAIQDRTFGDDGSLNFPNGVNQAPAPALVPPIPAVVPAAAVPTACLGLLDANGIPTPTCSAPGVTPFTPGPNPQVHPQWVPEYFADHALVNGVLWPKKAVLQGVYRVRIVDGSDARCYTLGFGTVEPAYQVPSPAAVVFASPAPVRNVRFTVIATEQGYLPNPLLNQTSLTLCPGERYEILIDFGGSSIAYRDALGVQQPAAPLAGKRVYMNNTASAPFPVGISPQQAGSPFGQMASIMAFDVSPTVKGVPVCARGQTLTWDPALTPAQNGTGCINVPATLDFDFRPVRQFVDCAAGTNPVGALCVAAERQLYLNEKVDGTTGSSVGLQINGVPFEYKVTETPRQGTYERWRIINTTVDAHPMHPHLGKYQIVSRQNFNKGAWLRALCGATNCAPGPAPGGIQALTPDVTPYLTGTPQAPAATEIGWKDAMPARPNQVLTFIGLWDGAWKQGGTVDAPGAGNPSGVVGTALNPDGTANWTYAPVTDGPYVWHCHINSHEDSEMMRTSLVVK